MTRALRRRWTAIATVLGISLAAGMLGAGPVNGEPAAGGSTVEQTSWVTLITGDRVGVRGTGARATVRVETALRGRSVPFQDFTKHGDRYLLPGDAARLVRSGVLDLELFNVTGLVRQGYDDAHTPNLPLLVQYADAGARSKAGQIHRQTSRSTT